MKKTLALLLCLFVLLSACPTAFAAHAEEGEEFSETIVDESGVTGEGALWLDDGQVPLSGYVEEEADLYGSQSFDAENAAQLGGGRVSGQLLIKFKNPAEVPGKEKQLQHEIEKFQKIGFVEMLGVYVVAYEDFDKSPNAVLNRLKNNKYIEYVEPNYTGEFAYIPNDPAYNVNQKTALELINAPAGWDMIKGGGPVVAVIDSGVSAHADLPKLLGGYSAAAGLAPTNDKTGHGTNVAGVVGAVGDNKVGVAGINWSASLLPVKVDDASGTLTVANIAKGIVWAADNGAKIINLSLGMSSDSVTLKNAIDYAYNKGCAIFAATGNNSTGSIHYPARYANVMAVGGASASGRASSSNYGAGIDVVAYGAYFSTSASGSYATSSGTSFASPQAAGLASLIWALNPSLSNAQVYDLIREGARPFGGGYNQQTGYGMIDIGKTLALAGGKPAEETAPKPNPTITLLGFSQVSYYIGAAYVEDGYRAADFDGKDITGKVEVSDNIDRWTAGLYTVTYKVSDDYGGSAIATRTVLVEPAPAPPPPQLPTITANGSGTIILHIGGTPYREQGARAIDYDGENISNRVEVLGAPDTARAGTYTLTYRVTGKSGQAASTARTVRVLAPTEALVRFPYSFNAQAKQGAVITHTNIMAAASGWMDFKVASLDKNMTITAEFIDSKTKQVVFKDTFSAAGMKQYQINQGSYEIKMTVSKANGNSKYAIELQMPEAITLEFSEQEVPLEDGSALAEETATAPMPGTLAYEVAKGDSLWRIAKRHYDDGRRWREIYESNKSIIGDDPTLIHVGQVLIIRED